MAKRKPKYQKVTSPAGRAIFPRLNEPDTKFDEDGVFKVDLAVDLEKAADFMEKVSNIVNDFAEEQRAEQPKLKRYSIEMPWEDEMDDDGNETGNVRIRFKRKAVVRPKDKEPIHFTVPIFDAKLNQMNEQVWGGSTLKVSAEIVPYAMAALKQIGASLRIRGVQVLELVSGSYADPSSMFDEEEGFETTGDSGNSKSGDNENGEAAAEGQDGDDADADF